MERVKSNRGNAVKKISVVLLCIALVSGTIVSAAAWVATGITTNYVDTAFVKGMITEEYNQNALVYPGGRVTKVSRVMNVGSVDAITRVKVDNVSSWEEAGVSSDVIEVEYNEADWLFHDGYYYYKKILCPGEESSPLTQSFSLSHKADNSYAGLSGNIILNMEMIQSGGGAESAWNIDCNELGIALGDDYSTENCEKYVEISFHGQSEGFYFCPESGDLFENFKNMIPGETISQKIRIINESREEVEMFLWAENTNEKTDRGNYVNEFLVKYSQLTVNDSEGNLLYEGGLTSEDSCKRLNVNLGDFLPGEEKTLFLTLQVLPEAGNEFSMLKSNVDWGIGAGGIETRIPDTSDRNGGIIAAFVGFVLADITVIFSAFFIKRRKTFMKKQK